MVDIAAAVYAGYHVVVILWLLAGPTVFAEWDEVAGQRMPYHELVLPYLFAVLLLLFAVGIAWELHRRREWGRDWFGRWRSVELSLIMPLMAILYPPPMNRYPVVIPSWWFAALFVIAVPAFIGKVWFQWRLSSTELRAEFLPKRARREE